MQMSGVVRRNGGSVSGAPAGGIIQNFFSARNFGGERLDRINCHRTADQQRPANQRCNWLNDLRAPEGCASNEPENLRTFWSLGKDIARRRPTKGATRRAASDGTEHPRLCQSEWPHKDSPANRHTSKKQPAPGTETTHNGLRQLRAVPHPADDGRSSSSTPGPLAAHRPRHHLLCGRRPVRLRPLLDHLRPRSRRRQRLDHAQGTTLGKAHPSRQDQPELQEEAGEHQGEEARAGRA